MNTYTAILNRNYQEETANDGFVGENVIKQEISRTPEMKNLRDIVNAIFMCTETAYHPVYDFGANSISFAGTDLDLFKRNGDNFIPATDAEIKNWESGNGPLYVGYLEAILLKDGEELNTLTEDEYNMIEYFADKRDAQSGLAKPLVND